MRLFVASGRFQRLVPDWIVTIALTISYLLVTQYLPPFSRLFSSTDLSISHPFAHKQRVDDVHLYVYAVGVPTAIVFVVSAFLVNLPTARDRWYLIYVALLGLWFALSLTCVVTDILKCWIANPRPDFLQRCGLKDPAPGLFTLASCTLPLGHDRVLDGLKSSPSGHSSLAFAGLGYLALWLCGQHGLLHSSTFFQVPVWKQFVCMGSPIAAAAYIALSRVQDYRHHPLDVFLGSLLGAVIAYVMYRRYFPSLREKDSASPHVA